MKFQECHSEVMRHGQKIYPSHHRIEMAVEIASLRCQCSSINQSPTRKKSNSTIYPLRHFSWHLPVGIVLGILT
uniref:Uncharacterized protein n=1 Tax=Bos mutus grunniens TaxID=30521 RepID=A0A8B9WLJ2_BOSMU